MTVLAGLWAGKTPRGIAEDIWGKGAFNQTGLSHHS